jgi:hypothetical protein
MLKLPRESAPHYAPPADQDLRLDHPGHFGEYPESF